MPLRSNADRVVLSVDASEGVRREVARVLRNGHANKTLFFLNPSTVNRLLALQATPAKQLKMDLLR
jgi:hypothetical protein